MTTRVAPRILVTTGLYLIVLGLAIPPEQPNRDSSCGMSGS